MPIGFAAGLAKLFDAIFSTKSNLSDPAPEVFEKWYHEALAQKEYIASLEARIKALEEK